MDPRRILLIRPSALGDVCRTVPVLVSLRRRWPEARIDWLVQEGFEEAISEHPALHAQGPGGGGGGRVVPFPRKRFSRWANPGTTARILNWMNSLRAVGYDLVIDAQGLARSGLFAWWTRAPLRVGYADAPELAWLGVNIRVDAPTSMHTVDRMLKLVEAAGAPAVRELRLYSSQADRTWLRAQPWAANNGRYVVIAPTSRWRGKLWPAERHAQLVRALLDDKDAGVATAVLVGARPEREQCGALLSLASAEPRVVDLIGSTSIRRLMAVIESSALVVGSDSAALHMAVGFDRPLIGLYGPTRVDLVGPYGRERDVIQHVSPADRLDHKDERSGRELMERIGADEVIAAARARLSPTAGA